MGIGILVLIYMFIPIAIVVGDELQLAAVAQQLLVRQFHLDNWTNPCAPQGMCDAVVTSVQIGLLATIGATILGTLLAFALVRHKFAGRGTANLVIFLPMASPEIVMGSSLLALFVASGLAASWDSGRS